MAVPREGFMMLEGDPSLLSQEHTPSGVTIISTVPGLIELHLLLKKSRAK